MDENMTIDMAPCHECKRVFTRQDLVELDNMLVCAECKPLVVTRILEGRSTVGQAVLAGFWIRFAAVVLDWLILMIPQILVTAITYGGIFLIAAQGGEGNDAAVAFGVVMMMLMMVNTVLSIAIPMAYEVYCLRKHGATLGKRICGLRVINADGTRELSLGKCFGRFFAKMLSQMICYIGCILAAFDDEKRALHDTICTTRVVRVS